MHSSTNTLLLDSEPGSDSLAKGCICMQATSSHELSDTRTVVLLLLHLRRTHHSIDPLVRSSDDLPVKLFWHHLFQHNFEELIDRNLPGSPRAAGVPDCILRDLQFVLARYGGLRVLLSQTNRFCMHPLGIHEKAALSNAFIRALQQWDSLQS